MVKPSLEITDDLKQRATRAKQRASFIAEALAAERETLDSGQGYRLHVHRYIKTRIAGENSAHPQATTWR